MLTRNILITGATGGIGRALAISLADQGARLWLTGRDSAKLERLLGDLQGSHHTVQADLTLASDRQRLHRAIIDEGAQLDVLINAAGVNDFKLLCHGNDDELAALITCNLTMPMQLCRLLLPVLNPESAQIVNLGSTFGSIGYPGYSAYCASKFGLRGFSQALSRELSDSNTVVQYIAPRATMTAMNPNSVAQMNKELGNRMDSPEDAARQIVAAIKAKSISVTLGWPERAFVLLNSVASPLINLVIGRQLPTIKHFAKEAQSS